MKKLILILSITLICANFFTVIGQNDVEKVNDILTELENEGGEFTEIDFESTLKIGDKLFNLAAECMKAERKNLQREGLYENETRFIWNSMDLEKNNEMHLMITKKEFEEVKCIKMTFREVYLLNMALNNLAPDQLKRPE